MPNSRTISKIERERRQAQSLRDRGTYRGPQMTTTLPSFTYNSFYPARSFQEITYQESTIISSEEHSESMGPSPAKNIKLFSKYHYLSLK